MRLVLLGAPGAGKGTQAKILSEKFNVPHISTGDIFRSNIKNGTELGVLAKQYIDKGGLVPDELTVKIVKSRLAEPDCSEGFVLDGFPRTIPQAEQLDAVLTEMGIALDKVVDIHVDDDKIIKRLADRRVCPGCGASYHLEYNPPSEGDICKVCGTKVIQRPDDSPETIKHRLQVYQSQTKPLIQYYNAQGKLVTAYGQEEIEDTTSEVMKALGVKK